MATPRKRKIVTRKTIKRTPRTQLEKLDAAVELGIEGPLADLIKAARNSTALRERGRKGKGRVR